MTVAANAAHGARGALRQISVSTKINYPIARNSSPDCVLEGIPNHGGLSDDLKLTRRQVVGSKRDDDRYCVMQAATATLQFRQFVSPPARKPRAYLKPPRDQTPKGDLRCTCDNERAKFNHQFDTIAISVARIEWLSLQTRRRRLAQVKPWTTEDGSSYID